GCRQNLPPQPRRARRDKVSIALGRIALLTHSSSPELRLCTAPSSRPLQRTFPLTCTGPEENIPETGHSPKHTGCPPRAVFSTAAADARPLRSAPSSPPCRSQRTLPSHNGPETSRTGPGSSPTILKPDRTRAQPAPQTPPSASTRSARPASRVRIRP